MGSSCCQVTLTLSDKGEASGVFSTSTKTQYSTELFKLLIQWPLNNLKTAMTISFDINRNIEYSLRRPQQSPWKWRNLSIGKAWEEFQWGFYLVNFLHCMATVSVSELPRHYFIPLVTDSLHCTLYLRDCSHSQVQKHQTSTWLWLLVQRLGRCLFSHWECCCGSKHYIQK